MVRNYFIQSGDKSYMEIFKLLVTNTVKYKNEMVSLGIQQLVSTSKFQFGGGDVLGKVRFGLRKEN